MFLRESIFIIFSMHFISNVSNVNVESDGPDPRLSEFVWFSNDQDDDISFQPSDPTYPPSELGVEQEYYPDFEKMKMRLK